MVFAVRPPPFAPRDVKIDNIRHSGSLHVRPGFLHLFVCCKTRSLYNIKYPHVSFALQILL